MHIDDHLRLLDGGGVLWLDSYEANKMVSDLMYLKLNILRAAVASWTVLIC